MITHEELLHVCHYDPETGFFTWKNPPFHKRKTGTRMGSVKLDGYVQIKINYKIYYAGPLAWFYMTGEWPPEYVDHKNRMRSDNRFQNLRLCSTYQNAGNSEISILNRSGYRGVHRVGSRYRATIKKNDKIFGLGTYGLSEAAALVYDRAAFEHFGEFANLNFPNSVHRDWLLV